MDLTNLFVVELALYIDDSAIVILVSQLPLRNIQIRFAIRLFFRRNNKIVIVLRLKLYVGKGAPTSVER